jgi:hypothetical protein
MAVVAVIEILNWWQDGQPIDIWQIPVGGAFGIVIANVRNYIRFGFYGRDADGL